MFIKQYLNEIKNRIFLLFLFYIIFFIFLYCYKDFMLKLNVLSNNKLCTNYFIFTSITELFSIYIDLIFFISNLILYFQFNYHLICFLTNGLYLTEYSYIKLFFIYSVLFEIFNFIVCHVFIFPILIEFFLSYQLDNDFYFEAKIYEYLEFYKKIYLNSFIQFQLVAILFLIISIMKKYYEHQIFIKNRKSVYFASLLIATILTPPDILSQIFIWGILVSAFEFFIFQILLKKNYLTWQIIKTN